MKDTDKNPKSCNVILSTETRVHEINGKTFIVKPVFKEKSNESATSILVKLLKFDSSGHNSQSY